jgi:hypothetical protein
MGLLSSDSREIFAEIALIGSKRFREKILESERDKPIIQVNMSPKPTQAEFRKRSNKACHRSDCHGV